MVSQKTEKLKSSIINMINSTTPIKGADGRTLSVEDIDFTVPSAANSIAEQLEMKYKKEGSLEGHISGRIVIRNAEGDIINKSNIIKNLIPVPLITERGTYLVNGTEKHILSQMRLKPGAYTNKSKETNAVKTNIMFDNTGGKYMPQIVVSYSPRENEFNVTVHSSKKEVFNGLNFLRIVGFSDSEIKNMLGNGLVADQIFSKYGNRDRKTIKELHAAMVGPVSEQMTSSQISSNLFNHLKNNAQFGTGSEVVKSNLAVKENYLSKNVIAAAITKTFSVFNDEVSEDDKDDLRFKDVYDDNDFILEQIKKDWDIFIAKAKELLDSNRKDIRYTDIRSSSRIGKTLTAFMGTSSLAQSIDETNPLTIANVNKRITQLGEGGMSSKSTYNEFDARDLATNSVGRIDPIITPESGNIGLVEHLTQGASIENRTIKNTVLKVKNGVAKNTPSNEVSITPDEEYKKVVAFYDSRYVKVTGNTITFTKPEVPARRLGKIVTVPVSQVDYMDKSPQGVMSYASNMIPFVAHNDGSRAMMGANMQTQAINLINREAPLVSAIMDSKKKITYDEYIGEEYGRPIRSDIEGVVKKVGNGKIVIEDNSGKKHEKEYYEYFPVNQGFINNEVKIKPGDSVNKGDMLAEGWQTKEGKLALGLNARVAYLPYKGHNYEDGIVVSKSFAKRMSSDETEDHVIDIPKTSKGGKGSKVREELLAETVNPEVRDKLDNDGIIKVGEKVKPGDILIGTMAYIPPDTDDAVDSIIASEKGSNYKYKPIKIDSSSYVEGTVKRITVIDNPDGRNKQRVIITLINSKPLKIGDKISGRHGNKGTITKILDDDEMPVSEDGKALDLLFSPLAVPSRKNVGQLFEVNAGLIAEKTGKPYLVSNFDHQEKERILENLKNVGYEDGKMKVNLREKNPDGSINVIPVENPVTVGNMYIMKLKHKVDDKIQARSNLETSPNRKTNMPSKVIGASQGEKSNPQSLGEMEMRALQGHQAIWNILESSTFKSDGGGDIAQRVAIFNAISTGKLDGLDVAATPETLNVMSDTLKILGLNVKPLNNKKSTGTFNDVFDSLALQPMKSSEFIKMVGKNAEVTEAKLYTSKDIEGVASKAKNKKKLEPKEDVPVKGGLADPSIFGKKGTIDERKKWGYINLAVPLPNPVLMQDRSYNPYSMLTGISTSKLQSLTKGESVMVVDPDTYSPFDNMAPEVRDKHKKDMIEAGLKPGDIVSPDKIQKLNAQGKYILWKAGGEALQSMMDKIDVKAELSKAKEELDNAKGKDIDKAYKKFKLLSSLDSNNMSASDLMMRYVPVAPSYLRPTMKTDDNKSYIVDDLSKLYGELIKANSPVKQDTAMADLYQTRDVVHAARGTGNIYKKLTDLTGHTVGRDIRTKRDLTGLSETIGGKEGIVRGQMLSKRVDFSGRSVIGVDPALKLNEVGIPLDMAKQLYKPFIIKELVDQGFAKNTSEAKTKIRANDNDVKYVVKEIAKDRPLLLNRQPSLHKFSVMAMNPVIKETEDGEVVRSIHLNPLAVEGFNADFDGDSSINSILVRKIIVGNKAKMVYNKPMEKNAEVDNMPFSGDTKIRYNYGVVNLGDFPREELIREKGNKEVYRVPENIEVLTIWNGVRKWLPVESFSIHKDLDMLEVKTNTSRTIHVSDDHSLVSVDEDLNYKRVPASVNLTIPRLRSVINHNIDAMKEIEIDTEDEIKYTFKTNKIKLDMNMGYLLGIYIGDGWVEKGSKTGIGIASDKPQIKNAASDIIEEYINEELQFHSVVNPHDFDGFPSASETHTWRSKSFYRFIGENIGHRAENKHLPVFWMHTDEKFRWGLLSGLIDTDGTVNESRTKSKKKSSFYIGYTTISRVLAYEIVALAHTLDLTASITITQTPKGKECYQITFTQESMKLMQKRLLLNVQHKKEVLSRMEFNDTFARNKYTPKLTKDRLIELRSAIGSPRVLDSMTDEEKGKIKKLKSLYSVIYRVEKDNTAITRQTALDIFELNLPLFENNFWSKWKDMVLDENIEWELITDIKPLPFITEAYDLTIPPAYTMVTESGFVIYDTMSAHVPITENAKEEAKKLMMPSENLINPTDGRMIVNIRHEMALGIYYLTIKHNEAEGPGINYTDYSKLRNDYKNGVIGSRTKVSLGNVKNVTAGQMMFNLLLPEKYRDFKKVWSKGELEDMFRTMYSDAEKDNWKNMSKLQISSIIDDVKDLGFIASTRSGVSIGTKDFKQLDTANNIFEKHLKLSINKLGDNDQAVIEGWRNAEKEIEKELKSGNVLDVDNPLQIMMASGARAKADQIRRMMVTVGVGMDVKKNLVSPIKNSHFDGLSPGEYWVHGKDSRKGMSDRAVSTSKPGAISREVWSAVQDVMIVEKDCKTRDGVSMSNGSSGLEGRVAADDVIGENNELYVKRNQMITKDIKNKIYKDSSIKSIKVRSPLRCKSSGGVCQYCYGTVPGTMQFPKEGTPVGVLASQALGEPVTQMTMNTFHGGGTSSGATLGLPRVEAILGLKPDKNNQAVLATVSGKVDKIDRGMTQEMVYINGKVHMVPFINGHPQSLKVSVGDNVVKGDFLTLGSTEDIIDMGKGDTVFTSADPKQLYSLKSSEIGQDNALSHMQDYLTNSMDYAFTKTTGDGTIDRRHLETIIGKMTSKAKVIDPGDSSLIKGSELDRNAIIKWNENALNSKGVKKIPIGEIQSIVGRKSADTYKDKTGKVIIAEGEVINEIARTSLVSNGYKNVRVYPKEIVYENKPHSKNTIPYSGHDNWFSNLGHQDVMSQLARGATMGQVDKLKDPRSQLMSGKLMNIGEGFKAPKVFRNSISSKMFNFFAKQK